LEDILRRSRNEFHRRPWEPSVPAGPSERFGYPAISISIFTPSSRVTVLTRRTGWCGWRYAPPSSRPNLIRRDPTETSATSIRCDAAFGFSTASREQWKLISCPHHKPRRGDQMRRREFIGMHVAAAGACTTNGDSGDRLSDHERQ